MDTDNGVNNGDRLAVDVAPCCSGVGSLFVAGMNCGECAEEGLECRRETIVSFNLGEEEGIAAGGYTILSREIYPEEKGR